MKGRKDKIKIKKRKKEEIKKKQKHKSTKKRQKNKWQITVRQKVIERKPEREQRKMFRILILLLDIGQEIK